MLYVHISRQEGYYAVIKKNTEKKILFFFLTAEPNLEQIFPWMMCRSLLRDKVKD